MGADQSAPAPETTPQQSYTLGLLLMRMGCVSVLQPAASAEPADGPVSRYAPQVTCGLRSPAEQHHAPDQWCKAC